MKILETERLILRTWPDKKEGTGKTTVYATNL